MLPSGTKRLRLASRDRAAVLRRSRTSALPFPPACARRFSRNEPSFLCAERDGARPPTLEPAQTPERRCVRILAKPRSAHAAKGNAKWLFRAIWQWPYFNGYPYRHRDGRQCVTHVHNVTAGQLMLERSRRLRRAAAPRNCFSEHAAVRPLLTRTTARLSLPEIGCEVAGCERFVEVVSRWARRTERAQQARSTRRR